MYVCTCFRLLDGLGLATDAPFDVVMTVIWLIFFFGCYYCPEGLYHQHIRLVVSLDHAFQTPSNKVNIFFT